MPQSVLGPVGDLQLESGETLRNAALAYVTLGKLAPDGRNAVLLTHGYTSSHMFITGKAGAEGSWAGLVGPGLAIDTDRYYVVSSNMLGSSFGSTAPKSLNPASGRAYGPDFPRFTVVDIVRAQKRLLDRLGVMHLEAVIGPSYGGFQAFVWGIEFPDFMDRLVPVVTSPKSPGDLDIDALEKRLSADPNWNGGHYYEAGGVLTAMTAIREKTLRNYGIENELAAAFPGAAERDREISRIARGWAEEFDAHSLLALGRAANAYDATPDLAKIKARVLYVLSSTDAVFPPSLRHTVMPALASAGVTARYHEIDSPHGHLASGTDAAKWADALRTFLAE